MMSKIVTSLQRSQNALLESPTGSGKTLALLCAALAWQAEEQRRIDEWNALVERATVNQDTEARDILMSRASAEDFEDDDDPGAGDVKLPDDGGGGFIPGQDDDDDFKPSNPKKRQVESSVDYHLPDLNMKNSSKPQTPPNLMKLPKKRRCPKIYFGTRTHKQVAQIVRELKKTSYSGVRMTILASREHTCIHPTVSKSYNKNQDCQDLMDRRKGGGCRFQANVKAKFASHHSVRAYMGTETAWDIEELVKAGKKVKACPYYAVRELKTAAQLVICPYNYLVEPNIRGSMEISLKNQVVILDEAHNIEDSARDAASGSFKLEDVEMAMKDCEKMVECQVLPRVHQGLASFLSRLCNWMQTAAREASDYSDFNSSTKVLTGTVALAEWNELVFHPENYYDVKSLLQEALKEQSAAMEQNDEGFDGDGGNQVVLHKKTSDLISGIFTVLDFMHRKSGCYRDDYRVSVVKAQERPKRAAKARGGWVGKGDTPAFITTITLNFWCLNPGVCFDEMLECRSIVLTSGTLSPMLTFASELEVRFPVSLEANHVIDKSQVWVGTLTHGPTGHCLNATYQNTNSYAFQDEVGRLVFNICSTIPHGVLVFLPSYKLLNDLSSRWKSTGLWTQIFDKKAIVAEPRFGDELETVMKEFYSVINDTNTGVNDLGQDGALFLAVCRGKVSEGLDFADNNARAVICVGIPFPSVKDTLVDLKKKYNDQRRSVKPNILPGREWYEIQAFRALNQALGRCIRHKQDWGAILMVDDRYSKQPRYVNSLSKWVRGRVVHYNNCNQMTDSLNTFTQDMKSLDQERDLEEDAFSSSDPEAKIKDEDKPKFVIKEGGKARSSWSPPENDVAKKESLINNLISARTSNRVKPLTDSSVSLNHLDSKTNLNVNLDNKTNLNGISNLQAVSSKQFETSFENLYEKTTLEETLEKTVDASTNKRKHSSTASECNFDIEAHMEDDLTVKEEFKLKKDSTKLKLSKFKRTEKKPLKPSSEDNLPDLSDFGYNSTQNVVETNFVSSPPKNNDLLGYKGEAKRVREETVLKNSSLARLEKENSEDLHKLLISRRKEENKVERVTSVPDTPPPPDMFEDDDDEFMKNLNFSDLDKEIEPAASSRRPLFATTTSTTGATATVGAASSSSKSNLRRFPGVEKRPADSHDMFDSDDECFNFVVQEKPSLSSADEIDEPEDAPIRKVKVEKRRSFIKKSSNIKGRESKKKTSKWELMMGFDSDDDFKP